MSVPTFASKKLIQQNIPTANHVIPCQSQTQYGEMTLVIGGQDYTLSNEEWMFPAQQVSLSQGGSQAMNFKMGPLGPQMMVQLKSGEAAFDDKPPSESKTMIEVEDKKTSKKHKKNSDNQSLACASTIMTMDIAKDMFLVGDIFMRKYYTVFDRANDRVGLAVANTNQKLAELHH